ncbi:MAG: hypothetical protein KDB53_02965 [Planctomycetes bacterium]|nr:hypothetical protein [Planctomycetota bacterium]
MSLRPSLIALLITTALCTSSIAQFDTDGPNATLLVNGQNASVVDPTDHDVQGVVPDTQTLIMGSGANSNQGVILLASAIDPTAGNILTTPWGGNLDIGTPMGTPIGNVVLIGDGVGLTNNPLFDGFFSTDSGNAFLGRGPSMTLAFQASSALAGVHIAFQAILQDPTMSPFFFDNTQAADMNLFLGADLDLLTTNDGEVFVPFAAGMTFNFHGQNKTGVNVVSNGYINFDGPTSDGFYGFNRDNLLLATTMEPAIFCGVADWDPANYSVDDGVRFLQQGTTLDVIWGDPATTSAGGIAHSFDFDLNTFSVRLELDDGLMGNPNQGNFSISTTVLDPTATNDLRNGMVGHTPGGAAITGGGFDINLRSGTNVGLAGEAQLEEHDDGSAGSTIGFDGAGTPRGYNNYVNHWNGATVSFFPNAGFAVAGDMGYTSTPTGGVTPPDTAVSLSLPSLSQAGGQTMTIQGSFLGFDPSGTAAGTVVFDPNGVQGGPFPASVVGILDDSGVSGSLSIPNMGAFPSIRDGQGLQVITPAFTNQGPHTVQITFASGPVVNLNSTVVASGSSFQTFMLSDDTPTGPVSLSQPILLYGVNHNSLFLNPNGYITFSSGSTDFQTSFSTFFSGFNTTGNKAVALFYTDLNNGGGAVTGSTTDILEDLVNGTTTVSYNNQQYWDVLEPAGSWSCTFDSTGGLLGTAGSVRFDLTSHVPATTSGQVGITGVSDGDTGIGTDTDISTTMSGNFGAASGGVYISPGNNDSVGEMTSSTSMLSWSAPLTFLELGTGMYQIL